MVGKTPATDPETAGPLTCLWIAFGLGVLRWYLMQAGTFAPAKPFINRPASFYIGAASVLLLFFVSFGRRWARWIFVAFTAMHVLLFAFAVWIKYFARARNSTLLVGMFILQLLLKTGGVIALFAAYRNERLSGRLHQLAGDRAADLNITTKPEVLNEELEWNARLAQAQAFSKAELMSYKRYLERQTAAALAEKRGHGSKPTAEDLQQATVIRRDAEHKAQRIANPLRKAVAKWNKEFELTGQKDGQAAVDVTEYARM